MILQLKNINKSFEGLKVLDNISFSLQSGSITSLFGENGSGKTTLFHIISGFLKPDSGTIFFNEKNINDYTAVKIANNGIGRVWQHPRFFRNLSVLDNLILPARTHPGEKILNYLLHPKNILATEKQLKEQTYIISENVNLTGKLQKTAGSLSLGEQKLLSIGMLLMSDAVLLLMDEPFAGVNPQMIEHISNVLINLKNNNKTICLIEHNHKKAEEVSDRVITLVKGRIIEKEIINE